jgi:hypothetical protein
MSSNETVLIIVTAIAALLLLSTLVGVSYKTRAHQRGATGGSIREEFRAGALQTARSDARARQHPTSDDAIEQSAR